MNTRFHVRLRTSAATHRIAQSPPPAARYAMVKKCKVTIYHNPRCTKSRETLELLRSRGIEPDVIDYLKTPPSKTALKVLLKQLAMKPSELLRTKEDAYKTAGLDNPTVTEEQILAAMEANPILIERPIVVANGKAVIGRPPENVLKIL